MNAGWLTNERLTDEDWAELAKVDRVSECPVCGNKYSSAKDLPEPSTCGMLACLVNSGEKEKWV